MRRPGHVLLLLLVASLFVSSIASADEPPSTAAEQRPVDATAPPPPAPPGASADPPSRSEELPPPTHAPAFSLWVGARGAFSGFGSSFFENEPRRDEPSSPETTGNFVGNGIATEVDVGARLAHSYVPYVFYERGFMGQGHRFAGTNASSSTDFYGVGLRIGGADRIGFVSDLSIGQRVVRVSNGGETYTMRGLEVFKLGLGAEVRLATLCTIDLMASAAAGSMSDTSGDVTYGAEGNRDGRTHPEFNNGSIVRNTTTYMVFGVGAGIHFDLFGK